MVRPAPELIETLLDVPPSQYLSQRAQWASEQPISFLMQNALANPQLVSLAAGFVDQQTLPVEITRRALESIVDSADAGRRALQYGTTPGYLPLREAVLARQLASDGQSSAETEVSIDQVLITAGSNQLLHLISEALFDPGDIVLCAAPTYFVYLGMLANLGARAVGIATDDEGIVPEALEEELERQASLGNLGRVKAIYVTSYYDNPSSISVSRERRGPLVEIAKRWSRHGRIHIIEDAAYRELRYFGPDIPSLRAFDDTGDTVIVTQTFSKSYSPGLRVGYGILPWHLVKPVQNLKGNIDFGSPNLAQHLLFEVLDQGLLDPHIEQLRNGYRRKLAAMHEAAEQFLRPLPDVDWIRPSGGLYIWLKLPESIDTGPAGELFDCAVAEGVLYVPGEYCYPGAEADRPKNMIRLSFGVESPEGIRRGIEALSRAVRSVLNA
jgi:2-aminoadipate transaminase